MSMEQWKELTKEVLAAAADPYAQDDVLTQMVIKGVPFAKAKTLYKTVGVSMELLVSDEDIKNGINEILETENDAIEAFTEWDEVDSFCTDTAENVDGADYNKVLRMLRVYCKEGDIQLPAKTKASGGGTGAKRGKVAGKIIDYFNANPEPTMEGMYEAVRPEVKGPRNAYDWVNMFFAICLGIKGGNDISAVNKALAGMKRLNLKDLEKVEA